MNLKVYKLLANDATHLHIIAVGEAERVARELVNFAGKLYLSIVPKMDDVRGILRIHTRCNDQDQIALAYHLYNLDATFNPPFDPEPKRLK